MAKKRIHINESQLYGLVGQALNELDWKTYMNAAKKSLDRGDGRSTRFIDAARDSFQRKHNLKKNKENGSLYGALEPSDNGYSQIGVNFVADKYNEKSRGEIPCADVTASQTDYDKDYYDLWSKMVKPKGWGNGYYHARRGRVRYTQPNSDKERRDPDARNVYGDQKYRINNFRIPDDVSVSPAYKDVSDYNRGRSEYTKGKGWNESFAHRVTESVMRKLRRGG